MTKKDYQLAAEIARKHYPKGDEGRWRFEGVVLAFIELFKADNPRFDEKKFWIACLPLCPDCGLELELCRAGVRSNCERKVK